MPDGYGSILLLQATDALFRFRDGGLYLIRTGLELRNLLQYQVAFNGRSYQPTLPREFCQLFFGGLQVIAVLFGLLVEELELTGGAVHLKVLFHVKAGERAKN